MSVATADTAPPAATHPPPADELNELDAKQARALCALAAKAHTANLELGERLQASLAIVDPCDVAVARFFVFALLADDKPDSGNVENPVSAIALRGIRLAVGDFREEATDPEHDGDQDAPNVVYGDGRDHSEQVRWLWRYLAAAKTAGELFGRALVVIAAEHYASRLALPASQQHPPLRWRSHKNTAVKALETLAGPHIAPSLKALERAIAKAHSEYDGERLRNISERTINSTRQDAAPEPPATIATDQADSSAPSASDSVPSDGPPTQSAGAGAPREEPTNGGAVLTSTEDLAGGATGAPEGAVDAAQEIDF